MTAIERRRTIVTLNQGNFQAELDTLLEKAMAAQRAEESGATPQRVGTRSKAIALAKEYDALLARAEESAVKVELHEISNTEWQKLADDHPPRPDETRDSLHGVNMLTFPTALLRVALTEGQVDLDALSRVQFVKLEAAAWNLHSGDDALPKFSLVSLLKQEREGGSKPPNASE